MTKTPYLDDALRLVQEATEETDRVANLRYIKKMIDSTSAWATAQKLDGLNNRNSAEDFMIEFMTAYNTEVERVY
jgi:ribosomal 50S subunit-associated protein YjgA (DUF615 family)